ncbi:MAG: hypothetical protein E6H52_14575 [Betaproteobacteria bacterium]|nr:MAG: hypothetical protein E6H52_14575 [Betaproteobacteria bacterium]
MPLHDFGKQPLQVRIRGWNAYVTAPRSNEILPLFTSRNLKSQTDCVPHQLSAGNILLNVEVLVPEKN